MIQSDFISLALALDKAGLVWHPEIGDEVSDRSTLEKVSILVDPKGLTPGELRHNFLWLPSVEQLVEQFEARQALIFHAGINTSMRYEAVVKTSAGLIETAAASLRTAFGMALKEILVQRATTPLH